MRPLHQLPAILCLLALPALQPFSPSARSFAPQTVVIDAGAGGPRFDGIGVVNGGGATSVLLKDYPEPQRSQIFDLVFKPKFGASVSSLYVEIPGDGNATQGSSPSHMHTRDDLNYYRGYTWWVLREAKKRNPALTLDGAGWSAPGWVGDGNFWSQDGADYYLKWLQGLRDVHGLRFDAIGCRNEKGVSYPFVKMLRNTLNAGGFSNVKIHAFDNWQVWKLDFTKDLLTDKELRDAIDIISAHTFTKRPATAHAKEIAARLGKPIWNTEEHIYLKGFDCAISIVQGFNINYIQHNATQIINWYDIAGIYPIESYPDKPPMILAWWPWSGHYKVREALWGYAHYGQFTEAGWHYVNGACAMLPGGGSCVTMKSPGGADYSIIIETKDAKKTQQIRFEMKGGFPAGRALCDWRSTEKQQFVRQPDITPGPDGAFTITIEPGTICSLSTTAGQRKGFFDDIPPVSRFPFPYYETFETYATPAQHGWLPRYTADITNAFEISQRPDNNGKCLRQVVPMRPNSWAPEWQPYTIIGDEQWDDYEVSADVWLNPGDSAGVMGRISKVRKIPRCYYLALHSEGRCRLFVSRGFKEPPKNAGEVTQDTFEQQVIVRTAEGTGEQELASIRLPDIAPKQWHNIKIRFEGSTITGYVDGKQVLKATDKLHKKGMAGLMAGAGTKRLGTPYYDNLLITKPGGSSPAPSQPLPGQTVLYPEAK